MVYEIIRQTDSKTWYLENPAFVRLGADNVYCLTNESNAHAVYIEGICYHIYGRAPIQGLDEVMVGIGGDQTYSNMQVKSKLDELSESVDDLIIAVTPTGAN